MSKTDSAHFEILLSRTKDLRSRYLLMLAAFNIYEQLMRLAAPNIVGKRKAEAAVKIMSNYTYFFMPAKEATRVYFFVELAKFFDKDARKQSLTLDSVLSYALNNMDAFSLDNFRIFQKERSFIPELLAGYKPLTKNDISKIRARISRHQGCITKLRTYRDKVLVHDDLDKKHVSISGTEVKILLKIIQDTVDLFYRTLDFASNSYKNFSDEPRHAVASVISALQEFEKERIKKINEKYGLRRNE